MTSNTRKLMDRALGGPTLGSAGFNRTMRGLRTGQQRDLYLGLSLAALALLRRTAPRRRLIYTQKVKEGSALVIHHRRWGDPKIEVVRSK